jgi:hypothetical protein
MMFQTFKQSPRKTNLTRSCYIGLMSHNRPTLTRSTKVLQQQRSLFMPLNSRWNRSFIRRSEVSSRQAKDILKTIEEKQSLDKENAAKRATTNAATAAGIKQSATKKLAIKKPLWQKIKEEAIHYWHGTKLLGLEVRISSRLIYKMLQGAKLTRRENRQVKETSFQDPLTHTKLIDQKLNVI